MGSLNSNPDFDRLTRNLLGKSKNGRISITDFKKAFPEIYLQIRCAAQSPFLSCWGLSRNVDENTGNAIVDSKILTLIGRISKSRIRFPPAYHSGLLHTFGYLFSLDQTPYGMKRDRWVNGVIGKGLGLEQGWLFPVSSGSFFDRVSDLVTQIVWKDLPAKKLALSGFSKNELGKKIGALKSSRIIEFPRVTSSDCLLEKIITDITWFRKPVSGQHAFLVYSIQSKLDAFPKVQTCFPVTKSAADELIESANSAIRLRFNSFVPGFKNEVSGRRTVKHYSCANR